jgi:hypothetical protein
MGPKGVPHTKTDRPTDRRSKHQLTNYYERQLQGISNFPCISAKGETTNN